VSSSIIERPVILHAIIPDKASASVRKVFDLTWRECPPNPIVFLIAGNTAHMPAGEIKGLRADV
jgi:hypothetical protein